MAAYQLPLWVWPAALMAVCVLAVWRGGDQERLAAGALLAAWALSMLAFRRENEETQWGVLIVDGGLFAFYVWMALRSGRFWPLFLAGFALLLVLTHVANALDSSVSGWAYLTAERIWSYLLVITIGYGAWTARRSDRRPK